VLPTDECHNCLIDVCTEAERLDEALALVKRLARKHGSMQQHTAACDVDARRRSMRQPICGRRRPRI
jgi:pentatricopeptide repeat protein